MGSNAMRVMVAELNAENEAVSFLKSAYLRLPLRLGEEVFDKGKISEPKLDKLLFGLDTFRNLLSFYEVDRFRAVATSAMRDASNAIKIQQKIKKNLGFELEVISGKEEAELIYLNFQLLEKPKGNYVIVDVGGGSTEVTLFCGEKIIHSDSFQIGSVRSLKNKIEPKEWLRLKIFLTQKIKPKAPFDVYGTGGNINRVHKTLDLHIKDPVSLINLETLYADLLPLDMKQRMTNFNLKEDRADVIVPAMEIYLCVLKELKATDIFVPKRGLSDGVLLDLYNRTKA